MIHLENVSIRAGSFSLEAISFEIEDRTYAMLMGKTGSGKTTLLEAICGLKPVLAGTIKLSGIDVTRQAPARRGIGYVPQDGALFSTLTVRQQLSFALGVRKWSRRDTRRRVDELAELLGVKDLLPRRPHGLSGGERQRVALGRALSFRPRILLLDEPLSALDEDTREQVQSLLKTVQEHEHVTLLHVTHSSAEARQLADAIFRLERSAVVRVPSNGTQLPDAPSRARNA